MKFKNEDAIIKSIKKAVSKRPENKDIAVFDADGTLWAEDINHILLNYQIQQNKTHFKELLSDFYQKNHRKKLCSSFVKKQAGLPLCEFRSQSRSALSQNPLHVFGFQRLLLKELKRQNMKIVIISASIQWLLEEAVQIYDLPVDQVLGVQTELSASEVLSDRILKPSSYENKAEVFLKNYSPGSCFLSAGNTKSDIPLLEMSDLSFVVHSAASDNVIFQKEMEMKALAAQKKWLVFTKNPLF